MDERGQSEKDLGRGSESQKLRARMVARAWAITVMGPTEKRILLNLATHAHAKNAEVTDLSISSIAAECGCSVSTVIHKLAKLEARGLLSSWKEPGKTSSYVLLFLIEAAVKAPSFPLSPFWGRN